MKLESLSFRDRFDILLEKRLSGVAGLRHIRLYGKCQLNGKYQLNYYGWTNYSAAISYCNSLVVFIGETLCQPMLFFPNAGMYFC